jgi:hypothetical protein
MRGSKGPDIGTLVLAYVAAQDDIAAIKAGDDVTPSDIIAATAALMADDPFATAAASGTELPADFFDGTASDEFNIEL